VILGPVARVWAACCIVARLRARRTIGLDQVKIRLAWRPDAGDIARGAGDRHRGYFWGVAPEPPHGLQLPDPTPARGELVIFLGHPAHASEVEIERTFEHEIGHIVGVSEEQLAATGLDA
jgi:hypothetical protein